MSARVSLILYGLLALPAHASVNEQRARLPAPADCEDAVAGAWKSHTYNALQGQWTQFTLRIQRVPGSETELVGGILNRSWFGNKDEVQPGRCLGRLRYNVSMDAQGTISGDQVEFWGINEWRLDEVSCGFWTMGYNLDHFSGAIDAEIQEFQSVNNDGGSAVNEPTVFRRIRCDGAVKNEDPLVQPPAFQPPRSGCGW